VLRVNYYQNSRDLKNLDLNSNPLIICPSPTLADGFRDFIDSKAEVITVAKWIKSGLINENEKRVGKAELMLYLASAWRKYFSDASENIFFNSFKIFTELRSFTLDVEIISGILDELAPEIKKTIILFWAVIQAENLMDEHSAYNKLGEASHKRPLYLIGFKHLSAIQIDMVKKISSYVDIDLFIPNKVKQKSLSNDWINWLDTEKIVDHDTSMSKSNLKVVTYSTNKLNTYLKNFRDIIQEGFLFKSPEDLFIHSKENAFSILYENQKQDQPFDFLALIEKEKVKSLERQLFLDFKIWLLMEEAFKTYSEYSDNIDSFFLTVLRQVVDLNTPRNFLIPMNDREGSKILNFDDLKYRKSDRALVVVLSKESSPFMVNETSYPDDIVKKLKLIGPLKRGGLDVLFVKEELKDIFKSFENVYFFIEEGVEEIDIGVREILEEFNLIPIDLDFQFPIKIKRDVLKEVIHIHTNKNPSLSASSLQAFQDCPRKYFATYIEKMSNKNLAKVGIEPNEIGQIEHAIIADYFQKNIEVHEEEVLNFAKLKLTEYVKHNHISIGRTDFNEVLYELIEYTTNGLNFLYDLKSKNLNAEFHFEFPLPENDLNIKGSIDCLVRDELGLEIYDFKRSQAAVGNKKEIERFEKLQVWIYRWVLLNNSVGTEVKKWGYVNLSEENKNNILDNSKTDLKEEFDKYIRTLSEELKNEVLFSPKPKKDSVCQFCHLNLICPKEKISIEGLNHES
jgi:CRISPR/Cas system-associated exonuclease Cas4 (RecB family)